MSQAKSSSHPLTAERAHSNLQFEVTGGVHSGVHLDLVDGDYSIGSKANADIVLRDEGVAAQHVVICVDGKDIRAEAIGGDVVIGGEALESGHGYRLRLPTELIIGQAVISLSRLQDGESFLERFPLAEKIVAKVAERPVAAALGVLGCSLAIAAASYSLESSTREETKPEYAMTSHTVDERLALPNGEADADAAYAARALDAKLQTAGIDGVKIAVDGRHIQASGRIAQIRNSDWTAVQRWFDKTYAPGLLLTASVQAAPAFAEPAIQLQAIWYGERPYIIADNGTRYYEGAVLDSGWLLQTIDSEGILLKKDEEMLTLSYR